MTLKEKLEFLKLSRNFKVTENPASSGSFYVTPVSYDDEGEEYPSGGVSVEAAVYPDYPSKVVFYMSGIYNSCVDAVVIDMPALKRLEDFCNLLMSEVQSPVQTKKLGR